MKLLLEPITIRELTQLAETRFGDMVKAVVDIEKNQIVLDADLHADQEALLLENGSLQNNLWGINLYPELYGDEDFVEFDSMINLRPSWGNKSRGVDSVEIQAKIRDLVSEWVTSDAE